MREVQDAHGLGTLFVDQFLDPGGTIRDRRHCSCLPGAPFMCRERGLTDKFTGLAVATEVAEIGGVDVPVSLFHWSTRNGSDFRPPSTDHRDHGTVGADLLHCGSVWVRRCLMLQPFQFPLLDRHVDRSRLLGQTTDSISGNRDPKQEVHLFSDLGERETSTHAYDGLD